jgi:hypothetical protein
MNVCISIKYSWSIYQYSCINSLFLLLTGPEMLLRQSSDLGAGFRQDGYIEGDSGDAIEAHEWKCVQTINGNVS